MAAAFMPASREAIPSCVCTTGGEACIRRERRPGLEAMSRHAWSFFSIWFSFLSTFYQRDTGWHVRGFGPLAEEEAPDLRRAGRSLRFPFPERPCILPLSCTQMSEWLVGAKNGIQHSHDGRRVFLKARYAPQCLIANTPTTAFIHHGKGGKTAPRGIAHTD